MAATAPAKGVPTAIVRKLLDSGPVRVNALWETVSTQYPGVFKSKTYLKRNILKNMNVRGEVRRRGQGARTVSTSLQHQGVCVWRGVGVGVLARAVALGRHQGHCF